MPADLPGLYFDVEKNRYFPISSRPPVPSSSSSASLHLPSKPAPHPGRRKFSGLADYTSAAQRSRHTHEIECSRIASTSQVDWSSTPVFGSNITAFGSRTVNGQQRRFMGDGRGWLYTSTLDSMPHTRDYWVSSLNLHPGNEVSSICVSDRHWISTGFGPTAKLAIEDLTVPKYVLYIVCDNTIPTEQRSRTTLLTIRQLSDVRASSLHDTSFVMGGKGKAVYLKDISSPGLALTTLDTNSDVFSLEHFGNIVFAGCRNGTVQLFDVRLPSKARGSHFTREDDHRVRSPVLFTKRIHGFQVLTSRMNGNLETIDIRFPKSPNPTMTLEGHVNNVDHRLGIAVDPAETFVFAAGDDKRIRSWSLRTGESIQPTNTAEGVPPEAAPDLLSTIFPGNVSVMQIVEEDAKAGLCLWAGSNHNLYQYYLGQKRRKRRDS